MIPGPRTRACWGRDGWHDDRDNIGEVPPGRRPTLRDGHETKILGLAHLSPSHLAALQPMILQALCVVDLVGNQALVRGIYPARAMPVTWPVFRTGQMGGYCRVAAMGSRKARSRKVTGAGCR